MKYISEEVKAYEIYRNISEKIWIERNFADGVLKSNKCQITWIDFGSIFTAPIFPIFDRLSCLTGKNEYFIAYHPDEIQSYFSFNSLYPIAIITKGDDLDIVCSGPQQKGIETSLCIAQNIFYIFDTDLKWLLYCEREYEVAMLVVFDKELAKPVSKMVKQLFMDVFNDDELLTVEQYFDSDWYDYLSEAERQKLISTYK